MQIGLGFLAQPFAYICHEGEIFEAHKTFRFPYAIYHGKTAILET